MKKNLRNKLLLIVITFILMTSIAQADVLGLFVTGTDPRDKPMKDELVCFGNFFCVSNDGVGSYIVTAFHVVDAINIVKEVCKIEKYDYRVTIYNEYDGKYYARMAEVKAVDNINDIALLYVANTNYQPNKLVSEKSYKVGTQLSILYDFFGFNNEIYAFGIITSNKLGIIDEQKVILTNIDSVGGMSGSGVHVGDINGPIVGMLVSEHPDNGITLLTPCSIIIDFLLKNNVKLI